MAIYFLEFKLNLNLTKRTIYTQLKLSDKIAPAEVLRSHNSVCGPHFEVGHYRMDFCGRTILGCGSTSSDSADRTFLSAAALLNLSLTGGTSADRTFLSAAALLNSAAAQ